MANRILIILFVSSFIGALWIFSERDVRPLRHSFEGQDSGKPGVIFRRFRLARFNVAREVSRISGEAAALYSPNLLEISGNVWAWRSNSLNHRQTLRTASAQLFFDSTSLSEILASAQLEVGYVKDQVIIENGPDQLHTDFAKYVASVGVIKSHRPVESRGKGRWFRGSQGFEYKIKSEGLKLLGFVNGVVIPTPKIGK